MIHKLLILLLFIPATVHSQTPPTPAEKLRVERLSADAAEHYKAGRFQDALTLYQDAWAIYPVAGVLFNVARCHEALDQWMEAADRYDKVVVDGLADPGLRTKAAERSRVARQRAAEQASVPLAEPAEPPDPVASAPASPPPPAPSDPWVTTALVVGGVGLGSLTTGGILLFLAADDFDELEHAKRGGRGRLTRAEALALQDHGESRRTAGTVLMALGGAALLGAFVALANQEDAEVEGSPQGLSVRF